ncbi:MAG: oligosaccharide flippase family protein [Flavobacteriales bacterium]|nr:oligosaccharide flippase family protein [Flavobacteriales bacterium]
MFDNIRKSYWFKSGSFSLLNRISITAFGLLNFILLVRIMTPRELGVWTLFLSVTAVFESIRNAFIYNPLLRYLGTYKSSELDIISASLILNLLTGCFVIVSIIVLSFTLHLFWDAPGLSEMYLIYCFGAVFYTWFSHYNFLQQANMKFAGTFFSFFVQKLVPFIYICYQYIQGASIDLITLTIVFVLGYFFSGIVAFLFALPYLKFSTSINFYWIKKLFGYGKFTFGTNISSMLNKNIGDWLIGGMIGTRGVALYNPAMRIANLFEIPLGTIAEIIYPAMIKRLNDKGEGSTVHLYERSVSLIILCIIPCVILVYAFAEPLVLLLAGEQYRESADLLRITILTGLFVPFLRQFGVAMNAIGKAHINFYFISSSAVVGVVITYFFVLVFGLIGAAYGSLITLVAGTICVLIILNRILGVSLLRILMYSMADLKMVGSLLITLVMKILHEKHNDNDL